MSTESTLSGVVAARLLHGSGPVAQTVEPMGSRYDIGDDH
jgi:hypothetical protein